MANKRKQIALYFPLGGLNRKTSYQTQPPYTTPDCLNVYLRDAAEGRERGGSRPGLIKSHLDDLGSEVRMLAPMNLALGDGFTFFSDNFSGLSLSEAWTQASWASDVPHILPSYLASVDTSVDGGEVVLDALSINTAKAYSVEVFLVPWEAAWHGKYRLYFRLDNTTPAIGTAGVVVELVQTGATGAYTASLKSYVSSVATTVDTDSGTIAAQPGWLTATVSGTTVTVYWNGTQILSGTVGAHTGARVGFGMECTVDGGLCLANTFRVQYFSTGSYPTTRSILYASSGGHIYKESTYGRMTAVSSNLHVRDDVQVQSCQSGQDLYIADYGDVVADGDDGTLVTTALDAASVADWSVLGISTYDMVVVVSNGTGTVTDGTYKIQSVAAGSVTLTASAGTGNCSYRIERAPKVFTPASDTLAIMYATAGQVPTGCPLVCRYLDRIVFAGAEGAPHVWYMSKVGTPLDWDYSSEAEDAAVAGTASDAGVPGDPILALVPHSDDYLVIGCRTNLWRLRGDPKSGGVLDSVSRQVGILGPKAWCFGPSGELIFMSHDGLYALPPGGDQFPQPLSKGTLPREFQNIQPETANVQLEYDIQGQKVHIYLTTEPSNTRVHWWMDLNYKSFWPVSLASDHEPTTTCTYQGSAIEDSGVILGGRDGYLRRFTDLAEKDCGTNYASSVVIGPIALAVEGDVGKLLSVDATLAEDSGSVSWAVAPGLTAESAMSATAISSGTWTAGLNATSRPACAGQAAVVTLSSTGGRQWAVESIVAQRVATGPRRIA